MKISPIDALAANTTNGMIAPGVSAVYVEEDNGLIDFWDGTQWLQVDPAAGGAGGGTVLPATFNGRLTLTTGVPVTTALYSAALGEGWRTP